MAATTVFSAPISPRHYPISIQHLSSNKLWLPSSSLQSTTRSPLIVLRASSSTPTVDKQDEEEDSRSSTTSDTFTEESQSISSIPVGGCKACGKSEIESGCNGEGRIQGGIATVPGFGWWPIKAYRPCPGLVATGGRYRRQGQSMDEVAGFGSVPRSSAETTTITTTTSATTVATSAVETQSSEKKKGPRKFKR